MRTFIPVILFLAAAIMVGSWLIQYRQSVDLCIDQGGHPVYVDEKFIGCQ